MSTVVKNHPVCGAVITVIMFAKVVNRSRGILHQLSYIELAKAVLKNQESKPEEIRKLKRWVFLKETQVSFVRFMSKQAFIPFFVGIVAYYLDSKISGE